MGIGSTNLFNQVIKKAMTRFANHIADNTIHITEMERDSWNNKAPNNHASTDNTHGVGDARVYGHLKLSDAIDDSNSDVSQGIAATPSAINELNDKINNLNTLINNGSWTLIDTLIYTDTNNTIVNTKNFYINLEDYTQVKLNVSGTATALVQSKRHFTLIVGGSVCIDAINMANDQDIITANTNAAAKCMYYIRSFNGNFFGMGSGNNNPYLINNTISVYYSYYPNEPTPEIISSNITIEVYAKK